MSIESSLPNWQLIAGFVRGHNGRATLKEIENFLVTQKRNEANARPDATMLSVNVSSRVHYAGGKEARRTNTSNRYDILYRESDGDYVIYDPTIHGVWEIQTNEAGTRSVNLVAEPDDPVASGFGTVGFDGAGGSLFEGSNQFRMESHLRDYLAQNLGLLQGFGTSLSLHSESGNVRGVEYSTEVGPIDILAVGANGAYYVIELKLGRGPDAAVGQTLRYIAAVKKTIAQGNPVFGVIIASAITDKLRYAASEVQDRIFVMQYDLKVTLNRVIAGI